MVEYQLPKLTTRVRFPSSAPKRGEGAQAPSPLFGADAVQRRTRRVCSQTLQLPPSFLPSSSFVGRELAGSAVHGASIPSAEERVKLACKRQGAKILAFGEIPVLCLFLDPACAFLFVFPSHKARTRKRGFAFAPKSASSSLVSGKAQKYSPLARFPSFVFTSTRLWLRSLLFLSALAILPFI